MTADTAIETMTEAPRRRLRRPLRGAVVASGLLLLAACVAAEPAAAPTASASLPGSPTTTTSAAVVRDGGPVLDAALLAYRGGYAFSSRVVVDGTDALTAEGRTVSGSSQMLLRSGDGEVEYLIVGEGQWARTAGGSWDLVSEGASRPPLDPLTSPSEVRVMSDSAAVVVLEATYPAAAFDLVGPDLIVTLIIEEGQLVSARYTVQQNGSLAEVETVFGPPSDTTPITAPVG